jgi:hypothetical protein
MRPFAFLAVVLTAAFLAAADAPRLTTSSAVVVRAPAGAAGQWSVIGADLVRVQVQTLDAGDAVILSAPGRYVVVWAGGQQLLTADVVVGGMPPPAPPTPVPPTPPVPTPTPIAATLYVTAIYEGDDLTPEQSRVLRDRDLVAWLDAGKHKLREIDDDVTDADGNVPESLSKHLQLAREVGLPAVIVTDAGGTVLAKLQLPATGAELLTKLQAMVGKKPGGQKNAK